MTRTPLPLLLLALGLMTFAGCPPLDPGDNDDDDSSDDDDATSDDDDDMTSDDDDMTGSDNVAESEPNDAHPFQELGVLDVGRTVILGTLTTAGGAGPGDFFSGDIDAFSFRIVNAASVEFTLDWTNPGDDLDMLLYASLSATSELGWNSPQEIAESATSAKPEEFSPLLSGNVEYTVLVGNYEGDPNSAYTLTIDVP